MPLYVSEFEFRYNNRAAEVVSAAVASLREALAPYAAAGYNFLIAFELYLRGMAYLDKHDYGRRPGEPMRAVAIKKSELALKGRGRFLAP